MMRTVWKATNALAALVFLHSKKGAVAAMASRYRNVWILIAIVLGAVLLATLTGGSAGWSTAIYTLWSNIKEFLLWGFIVALLVGFVVLVIFLSYKGVVGGRFAILGVVIVSLGISFWLGWLQVATSYVIYGIQAFSGSVSSHNTTELYALVWQYRYGLAAIFVILTVLIRAPGRRHSFLLIIGGFIIAGVTGGVLHRLGLHYQQEGSPESIVWYKLLLFSIVFSLFIELFLAEKWTWRVFKTAIAWTGLATLIYVILAETEGGSPYTTLTNELSSQCVADTRTSLSPCWIDQHGHLHTDRAEWRNCPPHPKPDDKDRCVLGFGPNAADMISRARAMDIAVVTQIEESRSGTSAKVRSGVRNQPEIYIGKGEAPVPLQVERGIWSPTIVMSEIGTFYSRSPEASTQWRLRIVSGAGQHLVFDVPAGQKFEQVSGETPGTMDIWLADLTGKRLKKAGTVVGTTIARYQFFQNDGDVRLVELSLR